MVIPMYDDELIKSLRICSDQGKCNGCKYDEIDIPSCHNPLMREAADAIEDLQGKARVLEKVADIWCKKVQKWIPVTERLPEEKDRYLTVSIEPWFGTTVVDTMRWSGVWMYDGRQTEATVTHWMPLPQPPKDGEA